MKSMQPDAKHVSSTSTADKLSWRNPESARARFDAKPRGYPAVRPAYHAPTDPDRMAEDVERWDGLS
jgi:hypothetical protein